MKLKDINPGDVVKVDGNEFLVEEVDLEGSRLWARPKFQETGNPLILCMTIRPTLGSPWGFAEWVNFSEVDGAELP